jgi:nucleotide-binding universal stress UspA family protein
MKNILVPFSDDPVTHAAVALAMNIANEFGSVVEILRAIEPPHVVINDIVPAAYVTQLHEQQQADSETVKAGFLNLASEMGITVVDQTADNDSPVAVWTEIKGREDFIVGDYGRLFDLIILSRRPSRFGGDWTTTMEAGLFESGRPVMLAPTEAPEKFGENVVVAWNGSTETARTIAIAMPYLQRAKNVSVVSIDGVMVPGPSGPQVVERLLRHGINAKHVQDDLRGRQPGEAVLETCDNLSADLLIKGAYTHSRLRQLIFGGATQHIILNAKIPVLLAH